MKLPCDACNGDGFVSHDDRHVENLKEVCPTCKGYGEIEARTGEVPQASASPDGATLYAGTAPSLQDYGRKMTSMSAQEASDAWHNPKVSEEILAMGDKVQANERFGRIGAVPQVTVELWQANKPTRLKQLYRHKPTEGLYGDCQRTCLAMMLGFSTPEHVPHFSSDGPPDGVFWDRVAAWLGEMGYKLFQTAYPGQTPLRDVLTTQGHMNPGIYYLLAGKSRNDSDHVVVCLGDAIWADPAIDDSGIVAPGSDGYYRVEVLVPVSMTEFRRPRGHEDLPETPGPV